MTNRSRPKHVPAPRSKLATRVEIPASRAEDYERAINCVERLGPWSTSHPISDWIDAARTVSGWLRGATQPSAPTSDRGSVLSFLANTCVPAMRLCRLCWALENAGRLENAGLVVKEMQGNPVAFRHAVFVLYVGVKIALVTHRTVRAIPTGNEKAPDLAVPSENLAIECKAHEGLAMKESLRDGIGHASEKLQGTYRGWFGCAAIDLGVVESGTMQIEGRPLLNLADYEADLGKQFSIFPSVRACVVLAS
ncbi:MAG: hypothetical protein IT379_33100 [Deltaproteobacteria bacterium]|nr:hypothetical protein [Deltaproteobacteria bacterium]